MSSKIPPTPPEWSNEPVQLDWTDEATGLPCFMRRGMFDVWCGYVALPKSHPWFGLELDEIHDVRVHGGLTWAGEAPEHPGQWVVGFDCGHAWDTWPGSSDRSVPELPEQLQKIVADMKSRIGAKYRASEYVMLQCMVLAEQAVRAAAEFEQIPVPPVSVKPEG